MQMAEHSRWGLAVHETTYTGAPIAAMRMAQYLKRSGLDWHIFIKEPGALLPQFETIGPVTQTRSGPKRTHVGYQDALNRAITALSQENLCGLYVNSMASAEWCEAANLLDIPVVLHTHELAPLLRELLRSGQIREGYNPKLNALFGPTQQNLDDLQLICSVSTPYSQVIASFVDTEELRQASALAPPQAYNSAGEALDWMRRPVAMSGSPTWTKGVDLFIETARQSPDRPFVWIGSLNIGKTDHPEIAESLSDLPANIFWTGQTTKSAAAIAKCGVFMLTSRTDSNPLVLSEALALGRPVIGFGSSVGDPSLLKTFGWSLKGRAKSKMLVKALRSGDKISKIEDSLSKDAVQQDVFKRIDISRQLDGLYERLKSIEIA